MGSVVVGLAVLLGAGSFAFGMVPLLGHGTIPPESVLVASLLSVALAIVSGWLFGLVMKRSWRLGLLLVPVALVVGLALFLGSSLPMRQACQTYHTDTVCPPWAR